MRWGIFTICCIFAAALSVSVSASDDTNNSENAPRFRELTAEDSALITDGDYMTVYESDNIHLTVITEKPISGVYIVWNDNPAPYSIYIGDKQLHRDSCFLHDYTDFEEPTNKFIIEKKSGGGICDIYLIDDETIPEFVQLWEPPCERADILLFSTHADDEYLMFGGTLPYYAGELDLKVQVAYLTQHYEEQPRPHELLDGLWAAGVENYPIIGIAPDIQCWTLSDAKEIYDVPALTEWTVEQIRRFRPSVVITHDKNGEYGHGAHKLCSYLVMETTSITGDENAYPELASKYGVWEPFKIYLHFWEENKIQMDWEIPLSSFGGITAREAAAHCYGYHKSQHIYGYSVGYMENWDCRQFGLFYTSVGPDEKADFMDHITPLSAEDEDNGSSGTVPSETEAYRPEPSESDASEPEDSDTEITEKAEPETSLQELTETSADETTSPPETEPSSQTAPDETTGYNIIKDNGGKGGEWQIRWIVIGGSAVLAIAAAILAHKNKEK